MTTTALTPLTWAKRLFFEPPQMTPLRLDSHLNISASAPQKPKEAGLDCTNQENLAPSALTADDLDETNTRLFVKSLSPELHDYGFLYRVFRAFGRIRMLALNTKRHNAIVEFETKVRFAAPFSLLSTTPIFRTPSKR